MKVASSLRIGWDRTLQNTGIEKLLLKMSGMASAWTKEITSTIDSKACWGEGIAITPMCEA